MYVSKLDLSGDVYRREVRSKVVNFCLSVLAAFLFGAAVSLRAVVLGRGGLGNVFEEKTSLAQPPIRSRGCHEKTDDHGSSLFACLCGGQGSGPGSFNIQNRPCGVSILALFHIK